MNNNIYAPRYSLLAELGYKSYPSYLQSPLWKEIRSRVLKRDNNTCYVCQKNPASAVHHTKYTLNNLRGSDCKGLFSVCRRCHYLCEFRGNRKLLSDSELLKRFNETRRYFDLQYGDTNLFKRVNQVFLIVNDYFPGSQDGPDGFVNRKAGIFVKWRNGKGRIQLDIKTKKREIIRILIFWGSSRREHESLTYLRSVLAVISVAAKF